MLYNKDRFHKVNCKKMLHKVKKNWVVVSVSLLGMIGAIGTAKTNVRANNVNPVDPAHNEANNQVNVKTPNLAKRYVFNGTASASSTGSVSASAASVSTGSSANVSQSSSASVSSSSSQNSSFTSADQDQVPHKALLGQSQHEGRAAATSLASAKAKLSDIDAYCTGINQFYGVVSNVAAQVASASNQAHAYLSRYSKVDPTGINNDPNSPSYGQPTSYGYTDNSDAALSSESQLTSEFRRLPEDRAVINSINANFTLGIANSLSSAITNNSQASQNASEIDNLYSQASNFNKISKSIYNKTLPILQTIKQDATDIAQDFYDVQKKANQAGKNIVNNGTKDAIVNVTTPQELVYASEDSYVHQINVMNNMELWGAKWHYKNNGNDYYDWDQSVNVPFRDLRINGLNDDGTSNTVDFGDDNFNLNDVTDEASENDAHILEMKNLHMYGTNAHGPYSADSGQNSYQGLVIYNNVTYVGSQLAYDGDDNAANVNVLFKGNIQVNLGAYSPIGDNNGSTSPITYNYHTGGLSPVPYHDGNLPGENNSGNSDIPNIALPDVPDSNIQYNSIINEGINAVSSRPIIQIGGGRSVVFAKGSHFNGYTTDGDGVDINGNQGGSVILQPAADVHLTPRGFNEEYTDNDTHNIAGGLPTGIFISGVGNVNIGNGASLDITPSTETDHNILLSSKINNDPEDKVNSKTETTAPAAIYSKGTGHLMINNGGSLLIDYPTLNGKGEIDPDSQYSLPNDNNGQGVVSMLGANSTITINPYATFSINGEYPANEDNNNGGGNNSNSWGNLVTFTTVDKDEESNRPANNLTNTPSSNPQGQASGTGSSTQQQAQVQALPHSSVILQVYGGIPASKNSSGINSKDVNKTDNTEQAIKLFKAAPGTGIQITDPEEFTLSLGGGGNLGDQLASTGVGIQGLNVDLHDGTGTDFGQYNQVTLPGTVYHLPSSAQSVVAENLTLLAMTCARLVGQPDNGPELAAVFEENVAPMIPFGASNVNDAVNQALVGKLNHSIDYLTTLAINLMDRSYVLPAGVSNMVPAPGDLEQDLENLPVNSIAQMAPQMIGRKGINTVWDAYRASLKEDKIIAFGPWLVALNNDGLNLQKGFTFQSVPTAYMEGVNVDTTSHKNYTTLSGFATPGSYIRINMGNDGSNSDYQAGDPIINPLLPTYDDTQSINGQPAYDPTDNYTPRDQTNYSQYNHKYIAIAGTDGHWQYTFPSNLVSNLQNLVVTSHVETVNNKDAARQAVNYSNGISSTDVNERNEEDINNITPDEYYLNPNNFPENTYPTEGNEIPTGDVHDPTSTDDDDAATISTDGDAVFYNAYNHNDSSDDKNAGEYFWAGRLKGVEDYLDAIQDPSIYSMPLSFIMGYKTYQYTQPTPQMDADLVKQISRNVQQYLNNKYEPHIRADETSAADEDREIKVTMNSLNALISPHNTASYYPYQNLHTLSSSLSDNQVESEASGSAIINTQDRQIGKLSNDLRAMTTTLSAYGQDISNNYIEQVKNAYNNALGDTDAVKKEVDVLTFQALISQVNNELKAATSYSDTAQDENYQASLANDAASSALSTDMTPNYKIIRSTTSSSEDSDFNSVASSYCDWGIDNTSADSNYEGAVNLRYHKILEDSNVYSSDSSELTSLSKEYSSYISTMPSSNSLEIDDKNNVASALSAITSVQNRMPNDRSNDINQWSRAATSDSVEASNAVKDLSTEDSILTSDNKQINSIIATESAANNAESFSSAENDYNSVVADLNSSVADKISNDEAQGLQAWLDIQKLNKTFRKRFTKPQQRAIRLGLMNISNLLKNVPKPKSMASSASAVPQSAANHAAKSVSSSASVSSKASKVVSSSAKRSTSSSAKPSIVSSASSHAAKSVSSSASVSSKASKVTSSSAQRSTSASAKPSVVPSASSHATKSMSSSTSMSSKASKVTSSSAQRSMSASAKSSTVSSASSHAAKSVSSGASVSSKASKVTSSSAQRSMSSSAKPSTVSSASSRAAKSVSSSASVSSKASKVVSSSAQRSMSASAKPSTVPSASSRAAKSVSSSASVSSKASKVTSSSAQRSMSSSAKPSVAPSASSRAAKSVSSSASVSSKASKVTSSSARRSTSASAKSSVAPSASSRAAKSVSSSASVSSKVSKVTSSSAQNSINASAQSSFNSAATSQSVQSVSSNASVSSESTVPSSESVQSNVSSSANHQSMMSSYVSTPRRAESNSDSIQTSPRKSQRLVSDVKRQPAVHHHRGRSSVVPGKIRATARPKAADDQRMSAEPVAERQNYRNRNLNNVAAGYHKPVTNVTPPESNVSSVQPAAVTANSAEANPTASASAPQANESGSALNGANEFIKGVKDAKAGHIKLHKGKHYKRGVKAYTKAKTNQQLPDDAGHKSGGSNIDRDVAEIAALTVGLAALAGGGVMLKRRHH